MQAFVVSDNEPITARVREVLHREGHECAGGNILTAELAVHRLGKTPADLIVFVLSKDTERTLQVLAQIHSISACSIIAVGNTLDTRLVLRALRAGANDYVDEADLESELATTIGRLRQSAGVQGEPARVVAVLAPSGGSGSSTLAVNIATALAGKYKNTLLLDLKLHAGDLAALLDLKPSHTLADLCRHTGNMDRAMFEQTLVRTTSGVALLAPPRHLADAGLVTPEGVHQTMKMARKLFPFIVVDVDHSFTPEQVEVLRHADVVLLVLRLDFNCLRNARRTLEYLDLLGISRDHVQVVVNRYGQPQEVPAAKAEEALGVKVAYYIPDDPKTVNRANNNGVPVVLESPSAKVAKSLMSMAAGVNGRPT